MFRRLYDLVLPAIAIVILAWVYCIGSANALCDRSAHLVLPPADLELSREINRLSAANHVAAGAHRLPDRSIAQVASP
jgi:hypothetical protein